MPTLSRSMRLALALLFFAAVPLQARAQSTLTLAERLGYAPDAKLLIVHADDIGVSHSVNRASFDALKSGAVSSGSIMVPCPWFPEAAALARENPDLDLGLHLTLTAEWEHYRWDAVLPRDQVPTLHDSLGFLHASGNAMAQVDPAEAEREIRAQVERAIAFGVHPTHLDSHMGTLYARPELFQALLRTGRDYGLPVFLPRAALSAAPGLAERLPPDVILIDRYFMAPPGTQPDELAAFYTKILESLEPGVTELIVHLAYDDAEMQAVTTGQSDYGAAWRQRDYDFVTSAAFRDLLARNDIHLITWREIKNLLPN